MPGVPGNAEMMTSGKIDEGTRRFSPSFLSGRRAASLRNSGMEGFRPLLFKALPPLRKVCRRLPEGRKKVPSGAAPDVFSERTKRGVAKKKRKEKSRKKPAELPSPPAKKSQKRCGESRGRGKAKKKAAKKKSAEKAAEKKPRAGQARNGLRAGESLLHEEAAERQGGSPFPGLSRKRPTDASFYAKRRAAPFPRGTWPPCAARFSRRARR